MYCYLPVFLCLFESFRRDLKEAKAVYISEYYHTRRFVIMTFRLRLKFPLVSWETMRKESRDKTKMRTVLFWCLVLLTQNIYQNKTGLILKGASF